MNASQGTSEFVVELRAVSKTFTTRRGKQEQSVHALKETDLGIRPGEFFTLLGPSGCGKTTTLRLIAGFEAPTQGEILIGGQPMKNVPPNLRPVNTVFQNYALFPHMNVFDNVAFGLVVKRVPPPERARRVRQALELVQLAEMGARKPSQLSGGQQQRVALARALVNQPTVLLLDEPLGALDLKLRKAMQVELKQLQKRVGITFVYVTHDQEEALTMSDRIAVMDQGTIQQLGDPATLYKRPVNRFVADFIGESNFIAGRIEALTPAGIVLLVGDERIVVSPSERQPAPGQEVLCTVRPEKTMIARMDDSGAHGLSAVVQQAIYIGTDTRYIVALASGEQITVRVQDSCYVNLPEFVKDERVRISWNPEDAHIMPPLGD